MFSGSINGQSAQTTEVQARKVRQPHADPEELEGQVESLPQKQVEFCGRNLLGLEEHLRPQVKFRLGRARARRDRECYSILYVLLEKHCREPAGTSRLYEASGLRLRPVYIHLNTAPVSHDQAEGPQFYQIRSSALIKFIWADSFSYAGMPDCTPSFAGHASSRSSEV